MIFQDLREYIQACKEFDELVEVKKADWDVEIGTLTEAMAEKAGPALLFDQIKDYPKGYRVLSNPFSSLKRTAMVYDLPTKIGGVELLQAWRKRTGNYNPVPPVVSDNGPLLENVDEGDAVDLFKFPAPKWHAYDGGRYLGTGCAVIVRDPDTTRVNLGTYRCMIQSKNTISVKLNKGKHGRMAMEKYHNRGENCPIAISVGHEPTIFAASRTPLPPNTEEYDYAGWLRNKPVEVVKSDLTGLLLPSHAEIVLEGEIPPLDSAKLPKEGPFGEWPGYYSDTTIGEVPLMNVKRVLYRNDPIILGSPPMKPPSPYSFALPFGCAELWDQLEKAGIPDIKGVWGYVHGSQAGLFFVVAIKQRYAGQSKQAGIAAATARAGAYGGKFVVVVDEDLDITNLNEVIWAIGSRCNVREDIQRLKGVWTSPADPAISPADRAKRNYVSDRLIIDACRPYQWIEDFAEVNLFGKDEKQQALKKFGLTDKI
ncbi:UbiD family decarboxylase [Thermodesulfobacteriota bacterium]